LEQLPSVLVLLITLYPKDPSLIIKTFIYRRMMTNKVANNNNSRIFDLFLIALNDIHTLSSVRFIPIQRGPSELVVDQP